MGNANNTPKNNNGNSGASVNSESSAIDVKLEQMDINSAPKLTILPNNNNSKTYNVDTMSPTSAGKVDSNMQPSATSLSANSTREQAGGYEDTEINIVIQNMNETQMGGNINVDSESSIQIDTMTFENTLGQAGGNIESEFDSNNLLNIIMQLGGDDGSEGSDSNNSDVTSSVLSSSVSSNNGTSSFQRQATPKNNKKKPARHYDEDDDSESSFDSDSDSDSSSNSDSDKIDSIPYRMKKKGVVSSDIYVMSASSSVGPRDITLMSYDDPLNYKPKSKKGKSSKKR
jgi:hypothetical protein